MLLFFKAAVTEAEKAVTSTAEAATTAKADVETKTAAVATAQGRYQKLLSVFNNV